MHIVAGYPDTGNSSDASNYFMGRYIKLAQVCQSFRQYFLSNLAWTRFDIHSVAETGHVYTYGSYWLDGAAGHFLIFLASREPEQQAWYFSGGLYTVYLSWDDFYDHLHPLLTLQVRYTTGPRNREHNRQLVLYGCGQKLNTTLVRKAESDARERLEEELTLVPDAVWTLCRYSEPNRWDLEPLSYIHLLGPKPNCIALISGVRYFDWQSLRHGLMNDYEDDWDIYIELVKKNHYIFCSTRFQNDPQFLIAMVPIELRHFGRFESFFEPGILDEIVEQIPGLLDRIANNYRYFRAATRPLWPLWKNSPEFSALPYLFRSHARFVVAAISNNEAAGERGTSEVLKFVSQDIQDNI